MVVMAPSTASTHANLTYPSNVTTFLSSEPHDAYRSDHIYESPDLVKAEVDKLNMADKDAGYPTSPASIQSFSNTRNMPFMAGNSQNGVNSPKILPHKPFNNPHNVNVNLQNALGNDNRNFVKFQAGFEPPRGNLPEVDDVTKRSNSGRDII